MIASIISPRVGLKLWLQQHRSSARLAFLLQIVVRILTSLLNLVWTRLLIGAMGVAANGVFINFQAVTGFAGLGDLGMGGAVAIKVGEHLARQERTQLRRFLAVARGVFMLLAVAGAVVLWVLSEQLQRWLHFPNLPAVGPYAPLFAVGAVSVGLMIFSIYLNNVNYGAANVMWPVIPSFLLLQMSLAAHWILARSGAPLWVQYIPYCIVILLSVVLARVYLRCSLPALAQISPIAFDWKIVRPLLANSVWLYFASVANVVYVTLARLLVMPFFGAALVPVYQYNYKLCELALLVISSAAFVALPKIAHLIASEDPLARQRASAELQRLGSFEIVLGCGAALVYLLVNSAFVKWWLPALAPAPMVWQAAFAVNLVVATGGDVAVQGALRCGDRGIRLGGVAFGLSALLNVASSLTFIGAGWTNGIAWASPVALSLLNLLAGRFVAGHLQIPWGRWLLKTWLLPVAIIGLAAILRAWIAPSTFAGAGILVSVFMGLFALSFKVAGLAAADVRDEWRKVLKIFAGRGAS